MAALTGLRTPGDSPGVEANLEALGIVAAKRAEIHH